MSDKESKNTVNAQFNTAISITPSTLEDMSRLEQALKGDGLLQYFNKLVNEIGLSVALSLHVKGSVISGYAISYNEFLKLATTDFLAFYASVDDSDTQDTVQNIADSLLAEAVDRGQLMKEDYRYLHLTDVQMVAGKSVADSAKLSLRIRIDSIDAFSIGTYQFTQVNNQ